MITYVDDKYVVYDDIYLYEISDHMLKKLNYIKEYSPDKSYLIFNNTYNKIILKKTISTDNLFMRFKKYCFSFF